MLKCCNVHVFKISGALSLQNSKPANPLSPPHLQGYAHSNIVSYTMGVCIMYKVRLDIDFSQAMPNLLA